MPPLLLKNKLKLYVIIMSRTSFRVNLHPTVCLNVKELLTRSRRHIWRLGDSNKIRTHDHFVCKRTLSHLAKLVILAGLARLTSLAKSLSVCLRTKWLWVWILLLSLQQNYIVNTPTTNWSLINLGQPFLFASRLNAL